MVPRFANAATLARRPTRAAGQPDPVAQYLAGLNRGEKIGPINGVFALRAYQPLDADGGALGFEALQNRADLFITR